MRKAPAWDKETLERCLGIALPSTKNAIKRAFHRMAELEHPDKSKHPEAKERFQKLNDAYQQSLDTQLLEGDAETGIHEAEDITTCGVKISSLGQGLGPTKNGLACKSCSGKGFNSYSLGRGIPCPACKKVRVPGKKRAGEGRGYAGVFSSFFDGVESWAYRCGWCKGTGGNTPKGCAACNGKGWVISDYRIKHNNSCGHCGGTAKDPAQKQHLSHELCTECKGAGEIEMFNPVLPRGLLMGSSLP